MTESGRFVGIHLGDLRRNHHVWRHVTRETERTQDKHPVAPHTYPAPLGTTPESSHGEVRSAPEGSPRGQTNGRTHAA